MTWTDSGIVRMRHGVACFVGLLSLLYISGAGYQVAQATLDSTVPTILSRLNISTERYKQSKELVVKECAMRVLSIAGRALLLMLCLYAGILARLRGFLTKVPLWSSKPKWVHSLLLTVAWTFIWNLQELGGTTSGLSLEYRAGAWWIVKYFDQVLLSLLGVASVLLLYKISPSRRAGFVIGTFMIVTTLLMIAELGQNVESSDLAPPLPVKDENSQAILPLLRVEGFPVERVFLRPLEGAYYSRGLKRETLWIGGPFFHSSTPLELAAIVAHELGHRAHHHFWLYLFQKAMPLLGKLSIFLFFMGPRPGGIFAPTDSPLREAIFGAFHMDSVRLSTAGGLCLSLMFADLYDWVWQLIGNALGRACEFDADRFSCDAGHREGLLSALVNAPGPNVYALSPYFEVLYRSHPSIPQRIQQALSW